MIDKKEKHQTSSTHKQVTAAVRCRRYCSHEGRHTPRTTPRTTLLIRLLLLCCSSYCGSSTASTYSGNGDLFPAVYTAPKSSTLDDKVVHCSCRRVTYSCVAAPSECYVNGYCDRSVEWNDGIHEAWLMNRFEQADTSNPITQYLYCCLATHKLHLVGLIENDFSSYTFLW